MPGETFSLTVIVDANEDIDADVPVSAQLGRSLAASTRDWRRWRCCCTRRAAAPPLRCSGQVSAALAIGGGPAPVDHALCPNRPCRWSLFVWGPVRIVPVRVTALTITERLYDATLNPVHAEVTARAAGPDPEELQAATDDSDVLAKLATVAYTYTLGVRQAAAIANLANAARVASGCSPPEIATMPACNQDRACR